MVEKLFIVSLVSALIGARLYHVISWFSYYKLFPAEIFMVWRGGLGIFGAIMGSVLGIYIYCRLKRLSFVNVLNLFAPPMLAAQAIGRLGNFFNAEGFGPPTDVFWRIFVPVSSRPIQFVDFSFFHPTFFYESLLCLLFFLLFLYLSKKKGILNFSFAYYLISYGLIRLFTEAYRLDTWTVYGYKVGFFLSVAMIISGVVLIYFSKRKRL